MPAQFAIIERATKPEGVSLEKDAIVAILGAAVSLAGLLLVFVGFVYARGEAMASRRGERFKNVARSGIVPFLVSIWCSWLCVSYLMGDLDLFRSAVLVFRADLIVTAWYAFIVLFVYL
jgi:hypothetical protein